MTGRVGISLAVGRYAITAGLLDGSVAVDGVAATVLAMPSPERHWRMLRHGEFDVAEVSLAAYLQACEQEPCRWTALPVFPHRRFRHGYVFVGADADLTDPADLAGRRVGLRTWATTAGVWMRGILSDHHGLDLRRVAWVTEHDEHLQGGPPTGYRISRAPGGASVAALLGAGEVDAVIYPERLAGPRVRPLFPEPRAVEIAYHRATGIFPIMHTVAIRRDLAERHPWLPTEVATAFQRAKDAAVARFADPRWSPLAWVEAALEEQSAVLGPDPYSYGFAENAATLDVLVRYAAEQGLVRDRVDPATLFWPATRDRPPRYAVAG